jgi:dCTP deaminase
MTIKSDVWLRRMAEERKMIDPFLPERVREANGSRIISAGASSKILLSQIFLLYSKV